MPRLKEIFYARLLNRAFKHLVKAGVRPTYQKAVDTLRGLLGRDKEGSILDPVKIKDYRQFPVHGFNKNLTEIEFDLEGLFDANILLAEREIEHTLVMQENIRHLSTQSLRLSEEAERELLLAGSNFLDAVVIKFNTLSNIDSANTNAYINLEDGYASLGGLGGIDRVLPTTIPLGPTELDTLDDDALVLAGSVFKSIFNDTLGHWQLSTQGDYLRFKVDLKSRLTMDRVRLETPDNGATVDVRLSRDGLNFIRPTDPLQVSNNHVNFFFETQEAQHIEFYIKKPVPEDGDLNVFTIQTISMYKTGYTNENYITTRELNPIGESLIKLLSYEIEADVPEGTSVDIEVAPISTTGVQGEWRRTAARILDFTKVSQERINFRAEDVRLFSSSPALGTPASRGLVAGSSYASGLGMNDVWGIEAVDVFPQGLPQNIDVRSLLLYRTNNWRVDTTPVNESVNVINRMALEKEESRNLYIQVIDEVHDIENDTQFLELNRDIIEGQHVILRNSEDAQIVRIHGTLNPVLNAAAVFNAEIVVTGEGSDKEVTVEATVALPAFAEYFDRLYIPNIGEVDILNVDVVANTIQVDNRLDYTAVTGAALDVRFQSRDLSSIVQAVIGNRIDFAEDLLEGERVVVTYNSPMRRTQEDAINSSMEVVSSLDSSVRGIVGLDYRIRENEIELLPTTRFPAQPNSDIHPVVIRFNYNRQVAGPVLYTVWCHVPDGDNRVLNIAQPIRLLSEEEVFWMNPKGVVVSMEGMDTLTLQRGWHRFTVRGNRAITEHGDIDQGSALWQLINLQSAGGSDIFRTQDGYFDEVTGFRDPLVPVGRFYIEHQALPNDKSMFAWEDGIILTTFELNNPQDAVRLEPGIATIQNSTDYKLEYRYHHSQGIRGILARLLLKRDPGIPSSITPIIRKVLFRLT